MADHVRKQIRDALAAALTGMATAARVYTGRVHPTETDVLPCALLFTNEETIGRGSKGGTLTRDLSAVIEGHAEAVAGLVDVLDTIAKEVEAAVAAAGDLGGLITAADLTGTEIEITGAAQKPTGLIRLEYLMTYNTSEAAPDVAL